VPPLLFLASLVASVALVVSCAAPPLHTMPPIRSAGKRKPPPEGFSDIETDLIVFANKMKDAANKEPPPGAKYQGQWEIFQISHQRSRYVYDLYYDKEAISRELYDWLLKNGYADAMLIAKWKKQGYEDLCCLRCVQTKETNFNSTCICRVPKADLDEGKEIECVSCGCRGCASSD
jgi:bud site selection protein 31